VIRFAGAVLWLSTQGGAINLGCRRIFDASLCAAADLQQMTGLCRQLVVARLELLRQLGHARDIELLFFSNDYCRPDWSLVDCLGEEAQRIVREIFADAHDVARAEDELELRARPN
jgi:hypothetical protein